MDTQKLIARLRERAATQDACGCWSLDRAVADELERLAKIETYVCTALHYPQCWDTAAYSTLLEALSEALANEYCSTCEELTSARLGSAQ